MVARRQRQQQKDRPVRSRVEARARHLQAGGRDERALGVVALRRLRQLRVSTKINVTAVISETVCNVNGATFELFEQQGRKSQQVSAAVRPGRHELVRLEPGPRPTGS